MTNYNSVIGARTEHRTAYGTPFRVQSVKQSCFQLLVQRIAENTKCSGRKHIPPYHLARYNYCNRNCTTRVPAAAPADIVGSP